MADQAIQLLLNSVLTTFMLYVFMKQINAKNFGWASVAGTLVLMHAVSLINSLP